MCHWSKVSALPPEMTQTAGESLCQLNWGQMTVVSFSLLIVGSWFFPHTYLGLPRSTVISEWSDCPGAWLPLGEAESCRRRRSRLYLWRDIRTSLHRQAGEEWMEPLLKTSNQSFCFRVVQTFLIIPCNNRHVTPRTYYMRINKYYFKKQHF